MKYYLVLGIEYKKYKKPANISIHLGQNFIDQFELDRDYSHAKDVLKQIDTKWFEKYDMMFRLKRKDCCMRWSNGIPGLIKVYEIDDTAVESKLEIKVINSNTDYTNGFMNKGSLIRFPLIALFKKSLVKNAGEKMMKALTKYDMADSFYHPMEYSDAPYPVTNPFWPSAHSFYSVRQNEMHEKSDIKNIGHWIGGSFTAEIDIKTKHHTKYLARTENKRWIGFPGVCIENYFLASYKSLLNIYNENT